MLSGMYPTLAPFLGVPVPTHGFFVVLGALVGGAIFMRLGTWLGVHVAKRVVGYRLRTGDLFAPAVALGMAVGRIGCLLPGEHETTGVGLIGLNSM
jgi:prolipoprotein diacylglyceryltransferase